MRSRWVFWAVATALTLLWVVANLPRKEDGEPDVPYVTKNAGWPDHFARWSASKDTGKTFWSTFSAGSLLFDLAPLAALIAVAWFVTRHLRPPSGKAPTQPQGARGARPTRGLPGTTRASG